MSTEAGVSRTGSPNRLELAATPLSGVIGTPANHCGDGVAVRRFPRRRHRRCGRRRGVRRRRPGGRGGKPPPSRPRLRRRRVDLDLRKLALFFWSFAVWSCGAAVCAAPGPAANITTAASADVETRKERNMEIRPRMRPRSSTGNTPRPNGEDLTCHRDLWPFQIPPFALWQRPETTELELYARTPRPTRSRVTRCWWQIYWLAGQCLRPPSQEQVHSQWQYWPKTLRLQLRGQPRHCVH